MPDGFGRRGLDIPVSHLRFEDQSRCWTVFAPDAVVSLRVGGEHQGVQPAMTGLLPPGGVSPSGQAWCCTVEHYISNLGRESPGNLGERNLANLAFWKSPNLAWRFGIPSVWAFASCQQLLRKQKPRLFTSIFKKCRASRTTKGDLPIQSFGALPPPPQI